MKRALKGNILDTEEKVMATIVITVIAGFSLLFLMLATNAYINYKWKCEAEQYMLLADDASTADIKLLYLRQYRRAIEQKVTRNDARYIFTQERLTRDAQLGVLATLICRLEQISTMDAKSFEYQTAMQQVTGQEFDHAMTDVDGVFKDCWRRQSIWRWFWSL
jgi:hypothetical protein